MWFGSGLEWSGDMLQSRVFRRVMAKRCVTDTSGQLGKQRVNFSLPKVGSRPAQICQQYVMVFPRNTVMSPCWVLLFSDEGGVHGAGVLCTAGPSFKKLLYQGRFLLFQLCDALALLSHLLCEESVLVLQSLDGLWRSWRRRLGVCGQSCSLSTT